MYMLLYCIILYHIILYYIIYFIVYNGFTICSNKFKKNSFRYVLMYRCSHLNLTEIFKIRIYIREITQKHIIILAKVRLSKNCNCMFGLIVSSIHVLWIYILKNRETSSLSYNCCHCVCRYVDTWLYIYIYICIYALNILYCILIYYLIF